MSKREHHDMSRKELKEDRVLGLMEQFVMALEEHKEKFLIGLVGVIVVLVAFTSLKQLGEKKQEQAFHELSLAQTALKDEDHDRAVELLKTVVNDYMHLAEGETAVFLLMEQYFKTGKYKQAIDLSDKALKKLKSNDELSAQILLLQAQTFEQMQEFDYAIKSLKRLIDINAHGFLVPEAYLVMARCYQLSSRIDQAEKIYQTVIADYVDTLWAKKATDLLHHLHS